MRKHASDLVHGLGLGPAYARSCKCRTHILRLAYRIRTYARTHYVYISCMMQRRAILARPHLLPPHLRTYGPAQVQALLFPSQSPSPVNLLRAIIMLTMTRLAVTRKLGLVAWSGSSCVFIHQSTFPYTYIIHFVPTCVRTYVRT